MKHRNTPWLTTVFTLLMAFVVSHTAQAELELHISKTADDGIPILIAPISGDASDIIAADLKRSGRFSLVDASKASKLTGFGGALPPADLQATGAEYLVRGRVTAAGLDVELVNTANGSRLILEPT